VATVIGLVGGAMIGDRIEGSNNQVQNMQQCTTQTYYENRPSHYNVVYEYQGTQYNTQMANDPGQYVRLQVTPVGAMAPAPQTFQSAPSSPRPTASRFPCSRLTSSNPRPMCNRLMCSLWCTRLTTRGLTTQPYYAPIGLSLNFGYSRGYGGHHHWR
jgi:hypothetical protein